VLWGFLQERPGEALSSARPCGDERFVFRLIDEYGKGSRQLFPLNRQLDIWPAFVRL
jgi:hypothetical protein